MELFESQNSKWVKDKESFDLSLKLYNDYFALRTDGGSSGKLMILFDKVVDFETFAFFLFVTSVRCSSLFLTLLLSSNLFVPRVVCHFVLLIEFVVPAKPSFKPFQRGSSCAASCG